MIDCLSDKDIGKFVELNHQRVGWITYNPFSRDDLTIGFFSIHPVTSELQWMAILFGDHIRVLHDN